MTASSAFCVALHVLRQLQCPNINKWSTEDTLRSLILEKQPQNVIVHS